MAKYLDESDIKTIWDAVKEKVGGLESSVVGALSYTIVSSLEDVVNKEQNKIYLVPMIDEAEDWNYYNEYLWIPSRNEFELIGTNKIKIKQSTGDSTTAVMSQNAITDEFNAVNDTIDVANVNIEELQDIVFPIKVSLSVATGGISPNMDQIVLNYSTTRSGNKPFTITNSYLNVNDESIELGTISSNSKAVNITSNVNKYKYDVYIEGKTNSLSTSITYYIMYVGASSNSILDSNTISNLEKKFNTGVSNLGGNITNAVNQYVWFCCPSSLNINNITSSGFDVTLNPPITVTVSGLGSFKCYRTTNALVAGTLNYVVS